MSSRLSPAGMDVDEEQFRVVHGHRPVVRTKTGGLAPDSPAPPRAERYIVVRPGSLLPGDRPIKMTEKDWAAIRRLAGDGGQAWDPSLTLSRNRAREFADRLGESLTTRNLDPALRDKANAVVRLARQHQGLTAQPWRRDW